MKERLKKYYDNPVVRNFVFIFMLSVALSILAESGIWGGRYQHFYGRSGKSIKPDIDSFLLCFGVALLTMAIFINPFYNLWTRRKLLEMSLEEATGLHDYYWAQARTIISKHGDEAPTILALRETDDFLTENQRKDFQKSRLAAETYLKATAIETGPYQKTVVHVKSRGSGEDSGLSE